MSHELTQCPGSRAWQLHLRQEVEPQQLGQNVGIDLVGLDASVRDRFELGGIRDHHPIHVTAQDLDNRPAVEGGLEHHLIGAVETPAELLDGGRRAADTEVSAGLAVFV